MREPRRSFPRRNGGHGAREAQRFHKPTIGRCNSCARSQVNVDKVDQDQQVALDRHERILSIVLWVTVLGSLAEVVQCVAVLVGGR